MTTDDFEKIKIEQLPKTIDVHAMLLTDISFINTPHTVQYADGLEHILSTMKITDYTLVHPSNGIRIVVTKTEYINNGF